MPARNGNACFPQTCVDCRVHRIHVTTSLGGTATWFPFRRIVAEMVLGTLLKSAAEDLIAGPMVVETGALELKKPILPIQDPTVIEE
ncbi:MAG TPA: hypothetical protein VGA56_16240 [Opitutaceae bacterium]